MRRTRFVARRQRVLLRGSRCLRESGGKPFFRLNFRILLPTNYGLGLEIDG
jgi:hypothetical protein